MSRAFSKKPASKRAAFGRPASGAWGDDEAEPVVITSQQVWNKALSLQGRREHSRVELTQKLKLFGASAVQIEEALVRLAEYSLQSDDRFAESLVRSQLLRGRGQRAIKQVLQQRGLDAEHPALAEQTVDTDWTLKAQELLQRRFGVNLSRDAKEKARYIRFLQYRGFSMGQAIAAMQAGLRSEVREDEADWSGIDEDL
ncbi:MAG: regulatory protein RecX [Pseudomonadota bacterium]